MEKILISACLVGDKTTYKGNSNYNPLIKKLLEKYELVPFCPEIEGGLSVPRDPAEIKEDKVLTKEGRDVTFQYNEGAEKAYNICLYLGIRYAILKDNSPSCGVTHIYDGSFTGKLKSGQGITAKYLSYKGITLIADTAIAEFFKLED